MFLPFRAYNSPRLSFDIFKLFLLHLLHTGRLLERSNRSEICIKGERQKEMVGTIKRIIERNRFECELATEQRDKGGRWSFSKLIRTFQSRNVVSRSNYLLVVNYASRTSYLSLNRGRVCPRRCLRVLRFLITSRCSSPTFPRPVIANFPLQTIFVSILSLYRLI